MEHYNRTDNWPEQTHHGRIRSTIEFDAGKKYSPMKRGTGKIIAGICTFFLGVLAIPVGIIFSIVFHDSNEKVFLAPAAIEYTIKQPGKYYLWNEYQTIFAGRSYDRSRNLPDGLLITIRKKETSEPYVFTTHTSISSSSGTTAKNSIGYIEVQQKGNIVIQILGKTEQRVFSFARFGLWQVLGNIFGSIGLAILLCFTGGALIVWGIITLATHHPPKKPPP